MDGFVDTCPQNLTEAIKASTRLGCGQDKYGNDQYLCLSNIAKSGLVEFCHNGIMGIIQRGYCLETTEGKLFPHDFTGFLEGCPDDAFRNNENYKYPACQRINTVNRCYLADPSCSKTTLNIDLGVYNTTAINNQTTSTAEYESADIGAIVGGLSAGVFVLIAVLFLGVLLWKRKQRRKNKTKELGVRLWRRHQGCKNKTKEPNPRKRKSDSESDTYEKCTGSTPLLPTCTSGGVLILETGESSEKKCVFTETELKKADINSKLEEDIHGVTKTGVKSNPEGTVSGFQTFGIKNEPEERDQSVKEADINSKSDERNHGNTDISVKNEPERKINDMKEDDQFSTLTEDEASVLFCFLCSDSGPPDFTDTEWLDMLNEIRQRVYHNRKPLTREEAQQTLDRLKSRDYLWEDQDKITKDTKDETIYRIESINRNNIPFCYSSYDTASVYLRSFEYIRKPGEKCFSSNTTAFDSVLILRLQMNILTHVTIEDTDIHDEIYEILNVSRNIQKESEEKKAKLLTDLGKEGDAVRYRGRSHDSVDHVKWLWRYMLDARPDIVRSCIGLHPHNDIYIIDNKAYRKTSKYHNYSPAVRCLLYCLLLTDKYQPNLDEQSQNSTKAKIRDRYFPDITDDGLADLPDGITETRDGVITFISDDIRHDVMYAFVTECLVEDSDLEFFLTMASRDVISEYCRSWKYHRSEGEKCLYVPDRPEKMYELFIDRLQLDIITHCTVSDRGIHGRISKRLDIPDEILTWDLSARERFAESLRHGKVKMFRARGMIVGCAGAGKTTLLRKLQRRYTEDNQPTETTVGLEVHEDLFEIKDDTLYDFRDKKEDIKIARFFPHKTETEKMVIKGILHHSSRGTKLISMTDFAGQVAYYACHQVYLSRRAFYIVVIDISKGLEEEGRHYDTDRHKPEGSLFHSWKYKDYFHFWLQSIQTYCDVGKTHTLQESTESRACFHPVITVASHADEVEEDSQKMFYEKLERCLSDEQSLKHLISPNRYFIVECPPNQLSPKQEESIECLRKCIVETVEMMPQWGEVIPLKWANLENVLIKLKEIGIKVISVKQIKELKGMDLPIDKDLDDGLRFLHEIGQIVYFAEEKMKDIIIVNVQWFVDAFKYIITDEKHLARIVSENIWINTGRITAFELKEIWKYTRDSSYIQHKDDILPYMDKLGLMTEIQDDPRGETFYIPSMNRTELTDNCKGAINKGQKTSIMVFHFKTYLPHFFFFRLVVNCFRKWKALDMAFFCKNAAFYTVEDASHFIAIAVNKTSIQLQAFTADKDMNLQSEYVIQIRDTVESLIKEITQTFHRHVEYERGFSCTDINITDEDDDYFLRESQIVGMKAITGKEKRPCPKHVLRNPHDINKHNMMQYWFK